MRVGSEKNMDIFPKDSGIAAAIDTLKNEVKYYGTSYYSISKPISKTQQKLVLESVKRQLYGLIDQVVNEIFLL